MIKLIADNDNDNDNDNDDNNNNQMMLSEPEWQGGDQ